MMQNDMRADPSDDFIAILGWVFNGPRGDPQLTIPMGYNRRSAARSTSRSTATRTPSAT